ncbi:hypothetical protein C8A00DRAFT_36093 [Chaetomidium leptoderma]|uniref:Uncharacterized protein n=1 Tax=Chaetomidium leptoderma TaxID=669021 RepID=A0AAN6ZUD3_9PEZI|nr:hypothetical protein C8A00DRAFT_36093 [Chaetomidium leptoderma]
MFHLSPSYGSEDDARTLHIPVLTEPQSTPGSRPHPSLPSAYVLMPRITVTPEYRTANEGTSTVWVAVQLSAQVYSVDAPEQQYDTTTDHQPFTDELRYGFLYDVSVEILPTSKSTVIEVLDNKAYTTILHPGSRVLFVAHIRLEPAARRRPPTHVRQNSDDLIEDLERQLGGTMTDYVEVRVTYRHSGFPHRHGQTTGTTKTTAPDGIVSLQTTMQTTGIATIKRHNSASPWSPPPCMPRPNPIFEVIASHWGIENAHAVMQRVIRSRSVQPRVTAAETALIWPPALGSISSLDTAAERVVVGGGGEDDRIPNFNKQNHPQEKPIHNPPPHPPPTTTRMAAPPIPRRQASRRCISTVSHRRATNQPPPPTPTKHDATTLTQPGTVVVTRRQKSHRQRLSRASQAASFFQASSSPSGPPPPPPSSSSSSSSGAAPPVALTPVVVDAGQGQIRGVRDAGVVVGRSGGGSVRVRKGKEKERGWGWGGWW